MGGCGCGGSTVIEWKISIKKKGKKKKIKKLTGAPSWHNGAPIAVNKYLK